MVSLGGMADVDVGDLLDYLATDRQTRGILLYVEALTEARKFMSAARAAARSKPVVVIKAGRSAEAAKAAQSHTGALAGSDQVYDAAFRRAGMLRVETLDELFAAVETLGSNVRLAGDRLAIVSNGGGIGVLATDSLIAQGGRLAELAPETIERLDGVLPPTWSRANPVDIIGDASGERYAAALEAVLADRGNDAVLVLHCPTAVADSLDAARATVAAAAATNAAGRRRPVFTSWLGESRRRRGAPPVRRAPHADLRDALRGGAGLHAPRALPPQPGDAARGAALDPRGLRARQRARRQRDRRARAAGRPWLSEVEAKEVLAAYGIPVVPTTVVASPEEAARAAAELGASGRAQDPLARDHPQVRHRRRDARPDRSRGRSTRRRAPCSRTCGRRAPRPGSRA